MQYIGRIKFFFVKYDFRHTLQSLCIVTTLFAVCLLSFFSILQDDFCRNTFLSSIENTNLSQQNSGNSSVFIKNTATFSDENTWCATSELEEEEIEEEHTQDEIAANYCAVAFTRTVGNAFDATQQADYGALQNIFWRKIPFYVLCCQRKIFF